MEGVHRKRTPPNAAKADLFKPAYKRLRRSHHTINVMAMFLGCASLFVMSFGDYRPEASPGLLAVSAGLLTSAAITAVAALQITAMLLVHFEDCDDPGRYECAAAWLPVVLIDIVIIEFLVGLVVRCHATLGLWPAALLGCELTALMCISSLVAFHLWRAMDQTNKVAAATSGGEKKARVKK
jgi:hypothetical protein